jgi:hypothetical protein
MGLRGGQWRALLLLLLVVPLALVLLAGGTLAADGRTAERR